MLVLREGGVAFILRRQSHAAHGTRLSLLKRYRAMPEIVRVVMTALIGASIGYATYRIIYAVNPLHLRATSSWLMAFLVNVIRQHALHRSLTFQNPGPYWPTLKRAYVMYSGSAVATTILNWYLTERWGWNHNAAWLACMSLTGAISTVLLKRYVFSPGHRGSRPHRRRPKRRRK